MTLDGLHPELVRKVNQILAAMDALGFPMKVVQALRSAEEQAALFAQGRTTDGKIVTNADGYNIKSNHQRHDDGYGHAADLAFAGPDPFAESHPWSLYGNMVLAVGLVWGGNWAKFPDRPHCELR
jgi:peptidoglycan L-alanyl-D-glutamate endopeptidase CwlK